jgi:hypothetical protein
VHKIGHEVWEHVCHLVHTGSIGSWGGISRDGLAGRLCLFYPLARDGVYDVEDAELVCGRAGVELLGDVVKDGGIGLDGGAKP